MTYNLTFLNGTQITDVAAGVNQNAGVFGFGAMVLLVMYVITYTALSNRAKSDAIVATAFICMILAVAMFGLQWIGGIALGISISIFVLALGYKIWADD